MGVIDKIKSIKKNRIVAKETKKALKKFIAEADDYVEENKGTLTQEVKSNIEKCTKAANNYITSCNKNIRILPLLFKSNNTREQLFTEMSPGCMVVGQMYGLNKSDASKTDVQTLKTISTLLPKDFAERFNVFHNHISLKIDNSSEFTSGIPQRNLIFTNNNSVSNNPSGQSVYIANNNLGHVRAQSMGDNILGHSRAQSMGTFYNPNSPDSIFSTVSLPNNLPANNINSSFGQNDTSSTTNQYNAPHVVQP